jgi:2-octaprenyl-6-methoxyphenol hydroxylase
MPPKAVETGMTQCDVIIGGGGMVGLSLAIALAKGGLDVVVADPVPQSTATGAQFDGRVCALAYASVRMFQALGVWDHLKSEAQPINDILVTDAKLGGEPSPFSLHFDAAEAHADALGHIVENRHTRTALFKVASTIANLRLVAPAALTNLTYQGSGIVATLANGEIIKASLAIAADGRESPMRELMGLQIVSWSYAQWGIVATVAHEKPHNGVAYEHFLPAGPFAILPMTSALAEDGRRTINRSSLVWTEKDTLAPGMMRLDDDAFDAEIARRFGRHLGPAKAAGPRWSYPLKFHLARGYVTPRFALAGDSAHGIHPIAGQGFNLGLKDAAALSETILDAARLGLDIGNLDTLKKYERWRRFDSLVMSFAMDGLNRLFSNDSPPLRALRDVGIGLVDAIGPARRFFMRHAGGDVGKLPRLMKGEAA